MANFELLKTKIEADPSFGEKLFELESAEDAQNFLKAEGMDFSIEDLNSFASAFNRYIENGGELSEEDLEGIAGGVSTNYPGKGTTTRDIDAILSSLPGYNSRDLGIELQRIFRRW